MRGCDFYVLILQHAFLYILYCTTLLLKATLWYNKKYYQNYYKLYGQCVFLPKILRITTFPKQASQIKTGVTNLDVQVTTPYKI